MAIYYKFKSAKDYDSIAMDGPFIPVGTLKDKIFESKHLGNGKDFDLVVTNAQTNEEYLDEAMLIPKNTSVLIRRVPGRPRMPIVTGQELKLDNKVEDSQPDKSNYSIADSSALKYTEDEWDEFGNDLYSVPEVLAAQSSTPLPNAVFPNDTTDEESKIQALIDTPALDWQRQSADGFGIGGRGYGRGMGGRMGGRGFGRPGMERKTPPQGYVCHRCNVPGHLIQNCPTNGDPLYDVKRVKPPTGIPKSMLMANPDGSYALPSGAVAVLKPNEHAFEKEMEGLPSTRSVGELPPELRCPLCKEVMKDAVLTSKCCFKSFCDKCIRDHIISKSTCVCGATDVLADDLLPNKTLRDTISRIMEAGNSSADIAGSAVQVQDMESARCLPPKIPSPATSAASKGGQKTPPTTSASYKGEQKALPYNNNALIVKVETETAEATSAAQPHVERTRPAKPVDVCEATHESVSMKEATSQRNAQVPEEEVQQQLAAIDQGKKKKKKKASLPGAETQWRPGLDLAPDYMMHMGPSPFNPYWNGVQRGLNGFMGGYGGPMPGGPMPGGPMPPFMGYGMGGGPLDMPFGGMMHPDPFLSQGFGYPGIPPHRDLAELGMGMGMNMPRPIMSREEFEARKADLRRKRENDRRGESGHFPRDRESVREANSSKMNISPMKPKSRPVPRSGSPDHRHQHRHRPERFSAERQPPPHPSKRMYNDRDGCREHSHDPHDHEGSRDRSHDHDRHRKRDKSHDRDRDWDHEHERKKSRHRERDHKHGHEKSQDLVLDLDHDREHKRDRDRDHSHRHLRSEKASVDAEAAQEQTSGSEADKKQSKSSVFSRISFPEEEAARKKHKVSSSTSAGGSSSVHNHGRKEVGVTAEYESSDEDRHFKRRPSRYEPSPPPQPAADAHLIDQPRHSKRSKHRT